jgi:hypothetical protein
MASNWRLAIAHVAGGRDCREQKRFVVMHGANASRRA